jgi:hypothetical protein
MGRFHTTEDGDIPFTAEEEAQWDAMAIEQVAKDIEFARTKYQRDRAAEYPSFADQFDAIFHGGIDAWKAQIQTIKDKYPKP